MRFESELYHGILIKRYKRFLADIKLDNGKIITAHCANSGALYGLTNEGRGVYVMEKTHTKLGWSWELAEDDGILVGVNTARPNHLVKEAIENGIITEVQGYDNIKPEQKYGTNSRIDFLLSSNSKPNCFLEVKNVHMMRQKSLLEFPDSKTERGSKHLLELVNEVKKGNRAVLIYVCQRSDCSNFKVAEDIDKEYAKNFTYALSQGVESYAYYVKSTLNDIKIIGKINIKT